MTTPRLLRSVTKHQYAIGDQLEVISVTESGELAVRTAESNMSVDEVRAYKSLQEQLIKLTDERDQLRERLQDHRLFLKVMAKDVF